MFLATYRGTSYQLVRIAEKKSVNLTLRVSEPCLLAISILCLIFDRLGRSDISKCVAEVLQDIVDIEA